MNIPKLRFPEFKEEWICKKLLEVGDIVTGSTPKTSKQEYYNGNYLFVSPKDIRDNRYVSKTETTLSEEGLNTGRIIEVNSVMFVCIGSTIGKVAQASKRCITNQQINTIIPFDTHDSDFVYSMLEYQSKRIKLLAATQAVPIINKSTFSKYTVLIPSLSEQTKIANFLYEIDKRIKLLADKVSKLEEYKKGVMQKLFSQEVRFKDENGEEFPEWKKKRLKDIGNYYNGLSGKNAKDFIPTGSPFIQYKQVFDFSYIPLKGYNYVNIAKNENQNVVQYGDVFFTVSSETPHEVGMSSVLLFKPNHPLYLNSFCFGFRPNSLDKLFPKFAQYLFRSTEVRKLITQLAQGSTRYNISKIEFVKLKISLPSLPEQTKIANFLSSIDTKIQLATKELDKTEEYKRGLLQQLFI